MLEGTVTGLIINSFCESVKDAFFSVISPQKFEAFRLGGRIAFIAILAGIIVKKILTACQRPPSNEQQDHRSWDYDGENTESDWSPAAQRLIDDVTSGKRKFRLVCPDE